MSSSLPAPSTIVVSSFVTTILRAVPSRSIVAFSSLRPTSSETTVRAGEDRDVLQHRLAAVAEAGGLHRGAAERAADLVHDERGERLALDVLGEHEHRLAGLHDLLEHRQQVLHRARSSVRDEDVGVLQDRLHALGVGDEVRRDVALVEPHALDELELHAEGVRLLDGDDAVLADLVDGLGDLLADLGVGRRDGADVGDLVLRVDVLRDGS